MCIGVFFRRIALVALFSILMPVVADAAEYQWSVTAKGTTARVGAPDYPRAFLWIPPNCQQVRAIVYAQNNMEEQPILEDPKFRQILTDLGFAEVWVTPNLGSAHFRFDQGHGEILEGLLKDLADVSGYQEIEFAPLVPMGHSAAAGLPWDMAAWKPERILAVLSVSGQWPFFKDTSANGSPDWGSRSIDGVPGLTTKGEYEIGGRTDGWYFSLKGDSLQKHPKTAYTQVVDPGAGHFEACDEKIALIGLYLRKAVQYRLPADAPTDGPPTLTPIDPTQEGWLFDGWHNGKGPSAPAAPVAQYRGDRSQSFWAFDEEMVKAIEDFQSRYRIGSNVLVGYRQKNGLTPPIPDHGMVHLKFEPEADGVTFKLTGGFWDQVPPTADKKDSEWQSWLGEGKPIRQGDPIPHPSTDEEAQITIIPIVGPVVQTAPDTFVIHPYRVGTSDPTKSNDIWLVATYPGDGTYKKMVQQAELQFPGSNPTGQGQTINFPQIPDQTAGSEPIKLEATASSGLPVAYYVREGPAEVALDGTLTFTPIPPRSKYPIQVTVVATQWGRSIDPKVQTAQPVTRTFAIGAPSTP